MSYSLETHESQESHALILQSSLGLKYRNAIYHSECIFTEAQEAEDWQLFR